MGNQSDTWSHSQVFYIFSLAGPLADKDGAEINGPSVKSDTNKWEMHTLEGAIQGRGRHCISQNLQGWVLCGRRVAECEILGMLLG